MTAQPVPAPWYSVSVRLALAAIRFYQQSISPRKGWCCAHRLCHGGHSCSEWAKRAVARHGLRTGAHLARRRFARCHVAAMSHGGTGQGESRWETEEDKKRVQQKRWWQRSGWGMGAGASDPCDLLASPECAGCLYELCLQFLCASIGL